MLFEEKILEDTGNIIDIEYTYISGEGATA